MSINRPVALIIAGVLLICLVALARPAWQHWRETPPPPSPALRSTLTAMDDVTPGAGPDHPFGFALAPDGRRLAFPGSRAGTAQLWLRDLTTGVSQSLPGTDGGVLPFWSGDGSQLGFFSGARLKALTLTTGHISDLADAPAPRGAVWHPDGRIIFAPRGDSGLWEWQPDGGTRVLTTLDTARGESSHRFPALLRRPGRDSADHVVFLVQASEAAQAGLWTTMRMRLAASDASAIGADDWLLYARGDALLAQRVDWDERAGAPVLVGRAELLGTPVGRSPQGQLSATAGGDALIYGSPQPLLRDLLWIERSTGTRSTFLAGVQAAEVRIAPAAGAIAVAQLDEQLGTFDIWKYEGGRALPRRISQGLDVDEMPIWSGDGTRLAWVQARRALASRGAQAQLPEQTLRKFAEPVRLWDWTRDGRTFVIGQTRPGSRDDLLLADASGDSEPTPYAQGPFNESFAAISPDASWLAYASDESGQPEIYIDTFPVPGRRARLTSGGGTEPRWNGPTGGPRADNVSRSEVFFRRGSEIHVVDIVLNGSIPQAAAFRRLVDAGGEIRSYDVTREGDRFLVNISSPGLRRDAPAVIVHWQSLLPAAATR